MDSLSTSPTSRSVDQETRAQKSEAAGKKEDMRSRKARKLLVIVDDRLQARKPIAESSRTVRKYASGPSFVFLPVPQTQSLELFRREQKRDTAQSKRAVLQQAGKTCAKKPEK
jgi:hypothetical protein